MEIDWTLMERYLAGECSPDEREHFEAWLAESPAHRQVLHELREVAVQSRQEVSPEREDQLLAELKAKLQPTSTLRMVRVPPVRRSRWIGVMKAAAVVALLVGGAVVTGVLRPGPRHGMPAVADRTHRVVTTPRGQRVAFNLPDGSRVILGVASTLEYPASFGASRDVQLRGEAYFEVEHDERHPFVVHAGNIVAKDLGTEFVVRAYPGDRDGWVVVRQGKVGLRAADAAPASGADHDGERVVGAGQLGRLSPDGRPLVAQVDPDPYLAWTEGRLVFDGTPLSQVVVELGRWYDVEFQFADSAVGTRDLYASFRNQSLASVLDEIAPTLRLRYERQGRTIILHSLEPRR